MGSMRHHSGLGRGGVKHLRNKPSDGNHPSGTGKCSVKKLGGLRQSRLLWCRPRDSYKTCVPGLRPPNFPPEHPPVSDWSVDDTVSELLNLYYSVGGYISSNTRNGQWGTGAIEAISQQLQGEIPGLHGFSPSNMKNMRTFFEHWQSDLEPNRQSLTADLSTYETIC